MFASNIKPRQPINDAVECLFIGGGFSALLTSARLREKGVESIRIVERGADVGGTWCWNRYPGAVCDVVAYDYLSLLDEMDCVPRYHYAIYPTPGAEEWWVQEVIANRGKTLPNEDCTPGYYNVEGQHQRRQDGNYNGRFKQYFIHMENVRQKMEENFVFS